MEAKEEWLDKECKEIEKVKYTRAEGMYKKIKALMRKKGCALSCYINGKDSKISVENMMVRIHQGTISRWQEKQTRNLQKQR